MREYVTASLPNEVTGIGAINIMSPNEITVTEIFLPHQKVNSNYSEFTKGELGRIVSNKIRNNPADAGNLCFRWHSHAHSRVFWSTIDEDDINSWKGNYVFNLVTNANGDNLIRLDFFQPFRVTIPDIKLQIDYPELSPELRKQYIAEVNAKVKPMPETHTEMNFGYMYPGADGLNDLELLHFMQGGVSHEKG